MTTIAWLAIGIGFILVRQVARGRTKETAEDLKDMFIGALTGNIDDVRDAANREGHSGLTAVQEDQRAATTDAANEVKGSQLLATMTQLGGAAKGYVWGAVGPKYYDCSGLVWRAMQKLGYKGGRFTTFTFAATAGKNAATRVDNPQVGDVVVWNNMRTAHGHMGVVSGANKFYSARSVKSGIGTGTISGTTSYIGVQPVYWRLAG